MIDLRPCVMVLNSDVDVLPPLYHLLSTLGVRVATYSSPWAACEYAATEKPEAILTSIGFPGCEGGEIVRLLREASPESRILVLATDEQRPGFLHPASAKADGILRSPHRDEEVLRRLRVVLEGRLIDAAS